MHIILIRLTVLSLHFQAVVSLPRSRYWLTPPRNISGFGVGRLVPSLPQCSCGIPGLGGCAGALLCMEKPAWELLGCREVSRHSLTLSCRILLFLLLPPCWTPCYSNRFEFYFEVLYSSLKSLFNSCYPPRREFLSVFFFSSGHCPLQLPFCKSWFVMLAVEPGGGGILVECGWASCSLGWHLMLFLFSFRQDRVRQK